MKNNSIVRFLALLMVFCIMSFSFAGCKKDSNDASSTDVNGNLLIGDATDTDDDDDDVTSGGSAGVVSGSKGNTVSQGNTGGGTTGKPNENHQIDEGKKKTFLESVPKSLSGQTVRVLIWWPAGATEKAKAAAFEKATGIKIKFVQTSVGSGPYYQKLSALKAQNSAPDLACILQESFPQAIMQDYFQPLSAGKLDLSDSIYDKNTMEQFKWNNKYYGAMIKSSTMVTFNVCFFNKDIFKKANVTNPYDLWQKGQWNWDTLVSTSQELMKKNSKLSAAITGDYGANFLVQTAGTDAVKFNNGKIINNCSDPLLSTAWKFLNDLSGKYKVFSGVGYSSFFSRDIPMLFTGNYIAQRGDTLDKQAKFSWGYAPLPCPKGQKTVVSSMAKLWGFPVGAKNTEAASYWLRYWLDSSFDPADAPLWSDKSAGLLSFNDWLWEQNKQFNNYQGIVNYGGNYTWEQMCNALASGSDKVDSNLKAWSGTINSNINKLMKDFG